MPPKRGEGAANLVLTLPLSVRKVKDEGFLCEAGDEDHDAMADWVIEALEDSDADIRFVCDSHLKSLESSPSALIAAVEAVELRIAERSNDDNLPAVTGLLDAEDEWFIKLLRAAPTEEVA